MPQRLMLVLLGVGLAACGGSVGVTDPFEPDPINVFVGTYSLHTVSGLPLPTAYPPIGGLVQITAGFITIKKDAIFTLTDYVRDPDIFGGGVTTRVSEGTYRATGSDITLSLDNRQVTGSLSGDRLTVLRGAPEYVYMR
ncbi:MAG: hypothetical protein ABIS03_14845 [Gemmatimonadaceae bacterium]